MASTILPQVAAVLYLRMSSSKQDKSLPAQRRELLAYAAKQGYRVLREYVDEAISGDDTARRTGFLRMREDVQKGEFSVVLCWDQDRFGRFDPIEGGYWILPFRNAGVRLETIAQGKIDWNDFAGRLLYVVQQEAKHAFLRDLSRNVSRGLLASARENRSGTGGRAPQGLRNDPDRAAVVRRIFAGYLKPGASIRSVAEKLNEDGIPTPRGKKWSVTTVRFVLKNRKYVGDFVRFKYRAGRYYAIKDGEIVSRTKADRLEEVEPIIIKGQHEAIVDRGTFDKAQAKLARQKKDTAPRTGRRYAFSGLLRCGDCGLVMGGAPRRRSGVERSVYRCHTYGDGGKAACFRNEIREDVLLNTVRRLIRERYLGDDALDRLRRAARRRQEADRQKVNPNDVNRLQRRIKDLDHQIEQGAERVFSAPKRLIDFLYAKLEKLRVERDRLQADLDAQKRPQNGRGRRDEQIVERAIDALRSLREAFDEAEPEDLRELIRSLVSKVELQFTHKQHGSQTRNTFSHGKIFVRPEPAVASVLFRKAGS